MVNEQSNKRSLELLFLTTSQDTRFCVYKPAWLSSHIDDLNQEVHPWSPVGYTSPKLSWAKEKLDFIGYVHTVHLMEKNPKGEYVQFGG